ncbi:MAG: cation-translocating P-type ATPase [Bacillota bacterium]|jgi:Ca2+-transporting ATPase
MKQYFNKTKEEVLQEFNVDKQGLSDKQVAENLKRYGLNALQEEKKASVLQIFMGQFKDLLVVILIVAAIISFISNSSESTIVILAVIVLNAVLGTVQHFKAEKSLESLKALSSPIAKVFRNNIKMEIPSSEILPGDIILLEAGDLVVADGRILENFSLQVNESSLTGESEGVYKIDEAINQDQVPLGDQINMVFSGSLVTYGRAIVLVTATGMQTELGKIAALMNATKEKKTPLQISLDNFSKKLAILIMLICVIVFALSIYREMPIIDAMMFAVALAVAAIPEALGSIVTIVLAMGTQKMAKENAVIKELKAVESLGSVSVICSDKTGTLTQNKMTAQKVFVDGQVLDGEDLKITENPAHKYLIDAAVLANDATVAEGKEIGDPTELALVVLARKLNLDESIYRNECLRHAELAFDSERKLMSTLHNVEGKTMMFTKGALDVLLQRSTHIATSKGKRLLTEADRNFILNTNKWLSGQGLRVLSFAYKECNGTCSLCLEDEKELVFLGLISMMDPPRPESVQAVADAKMAGIKTIMITGDHKITATAIAQQIGIFDEGDIAIEGREIDALSNAELDKKLSHISVYARVSPEHKIRIVEAWQRCGNIVAMTGDGVNDAPALKKADIGVAMGITGTEVSKDASAMILADDNFATIVKAVANGRNVFTSIKNAIQFLLSGNTSGILVVLYASLAALPVPFAAVHLLFINLVTDSLPALAIGMEPPSGHLLKQKPRNPKQGILNKDFLRKILVQGAIIGFFTLMAYYMGLRQGGAALATTMAFSTLTLARLFHGFNCRSDKSMLRLGIRSNLSSLWAFLAGFVILHAVLFVPMLQKLFLVQPLNNTQLLFIYLFAFCPTLIIQSYKVAKEAWEGSKSSYPASG